MRRALVPVMLLCQTIACAGASPQPEAASAEPVNRRDAGACQQGERTARETWSNAVDASRKRLADHEKRLGVGRRILPAVLELERRAASATARDFQVIKDRCAQVESLANDRQTPGAAEALLLTAKLRQGMLDDDVAAVRKATHFIGPHCGTRAPGVPPPGPSPPISERIREAIRVSEVALAANRHATDLADAERAAAISLHEAVQRVGTLAPAFDEVKQAVDKWAYACKYGEDAGL